MADKSITPSELSCQLVRFREGDREALNQLILLASERLQVLAHRMLRDYPRVRRWAQTDDVLQSALIRLCRALETIQPASAREFYALATTQIRRELLDLARQYSGPQNAAAHHESWVAAPGDDQIVHDRLELTHEPGVLADWHEFHDQVNRLPDEQREVFELLFYQGLNQEDAAAVLGVTVRTVQRRWQAAMLALHELRNGEAPGT